MLTEPLRLEHVKPRLLGHWGTTPGLNFIYVHLNRIIVDRNVDVLFVAGCEENQVRFHPRFDLIILLSAPVEVLAERLASRTTNSFGRAPGELERVLDDLQTVEPLLRKAATYEIRTTMPLGDVVAVVLQLAGA